MFHNTRYCFRYQPAGSGVLAAKTPLPTRGPTRQHYRELQSLLTLPGSSARATNTKPQIARRSSLPLRGENIELVRRLRAFVRREHDRLAIRRKLGKRRESTKIRDLL